MPPLRPILSAFFLLARMVTAPRFPQLVGAAVPLFSLVLVGLLGSLPFVVAAVCHAAPFVSAVTRLSPGPLVFLPSYSFHRGCQRFSPSFVCQFWL